jgi:Helicase associated domain
VSGPTRGGVPDVLWFGDRSEYETTDFDGRLRRAVVVRELRRSPTGQTYLLVRLEPPLTLDDTVHAEVVLAERHAETSLLELGDGSISVYVFEASGVDTGAAGSEVRWSGPLAWADVALDPANLPPTREALWEQSFAVLEAFAVREGTAQVPLDDAEGELSLGTWVANQKHLQAAGRLRPEWAARLEALPGWDWYSTDEFGLLAAYARREGHTDVPVDHVEDNRPLGGWLRFVRESRDHLPPDWVTRLEAVPQWHW